MNKKKKTTRIKHRKNRERMKELIRASRLKAKPKKVEVPKQIETDNQVVEEIKAPTKKPAAKKKAPAKKTAAKKKAPAKKPAAKKKAPAKKPAAKKKAK